VVKNTNKDSTKGTIDLEDMDSHFGDDDSLASAINAALEDADAAVSKKTQSAKPAPESQIEVEVEDDDFEIVMEAEEIEPEVVEETEVAEKTAKVKQQEEKPQGLAEIVEDLEEEPENLDNQPKPAEAPPKKEAPKPKENVANDDYYERLLRVMAEFENYKKRMVKDKEDFQRFSQEKLLIQFLPVLDNFERAISHGDKNEHTKPLLDGIVMILKQLRDVLSKSGVRSFKSVGKPFDPAKHQAVQMRETDEVEPNTVIEEFQKGYFLHDRLIRAAMVVVAEKPSVIPDTDLPSLDDTELPDLGGSEEEDIEELQPMSMENDSIEELVEIVDEQTEVIDDIEELQPID